MEIITGITGAAAAEEPELRPEPEIQPEKPEPTLEERGFSLVGRALRFVMKTVTPGAWQSVVQQMAEQLPRKIELEPASELAWEHESRHLQLVEDLQDQGFVDAGMFRAANMNTNLHLLVNEAYDIRAVVYEHGNSGIVLDLVTLFGDGTGITYVNREAPGYEQSPLHPNIYLGDVPVFDLLDTCLRERPKKARLPETPATAAPLMELEYEFGAKRLRGESVNPVEIADAYLEVIERCGAVKVEVAPPVAPEIEAPVVEAEATPSAEVKAEPVRWTGRFEHVLPPREEAIGLAVAEHKAAPSGNAKKAIAGNAK